jgi:hypothetical protein
VKEPRSRSFVFVFWALSPPIAFSHRREMCRVRYKKKSLVQYDRVHLGSIFIFACLFSFCGFSSRLLNHACNFLLFEEKDHNVAKDNATASALSPITSAAPAQFTGGNGATPTTADINGEEQRAVTNIRFTSTLPQLQAVTSHAAEHLQRWWWRKPPPTSNLEFNFDTEKP